MKTQVYQKHVPCGFCLIIVDDKGKVLYSKIYRGEDCIEIFCKEIVESTKNLFIMLEKNCPIKKITEFQRKKFEEASNCHICKKKFKFTEIKVKIINSIII